MSAPRMNMECIYTSRHTHMCTYLSRVRLVEFTEVSGEVVNVGHVDLNRRYLCDSIKDQLGYVVHRVLQEDRPKCDSI